MGWDARGEQSANEVTDTQSDMPQNDPYTLHKHPFISPAKPCIAGYRITGNKKPISTLIEFPTTALFPSRKLFQSPTNVVYWPLPPWTWLTSPSRSPTSSGALLILMNSWPNCQHRPSSTRVPFRLCQPSENAGFRYSRNMASCGCRLSGCIWTETRRGLIPSPAPLPAPRPSIDIMTFKRELIRYLYQNSI